MTHPYPSYRPVLDRSMIPGDSMPDNRYVDPDSRIPDVHEDTIDERRDNLPPPIMHRAPAFLHYPKARDVIVLNSGTNIADQMLGFDCRAIVIQNVGTNGFIFCPELNMYLTTASTPQATFNLPSRLEKLSLQWHTAAFNATAPVGVAGQFAILWLFDEWIPPSTAASGGGAGGSTVVTAANAAPTQVAFSAVDVVALAANASRKGASFFNHATSDCYLQFGAAATTGNFKIRIRPEEYYELAPEAIYTGAIHAIFDAGGSGNLNVTELS